MHICIHLPIKAYRDNLFIVFIIFHNHKRGIKTLSWTSTRINLICFRAYRKMEEEIDIHTLRNIGRGPSLVGHTWSSSMSTSTLPPLRWWEEGGSCSTMAISIISSLLLISIISSKRHRKKEWQVQRERAPSRLPFSPFNQVARNAWMSMRNRTTSNQPRACLLCYIYTVVFLFFFCTLFGDPQSF